MNVAKISVTRPVMITMIISVFLIFGIIGYLTLNLNLFPDVEIPYVTVSTVYPGAGPKEVETLISKRVEEVVSTISQIDRVESYSMDGMSIVMIQFRIGKNVNLAHQEVKDKVDEILNKLPTDAKKPIIQKVDFKAFPVVNLVLSGPLNPREMYELADKRLKDRFSQISGVAKVDIAGGQERIVKISLDSKVAFENSISLPQLLQILKAHNMDIPGGYFQIKDQEFTVRLKGEFNDIEAIRELEIPTMFGPKKLRQIATVSDSGKDIRRLSIYHNLKENYKNENVILFGIVKAAEGNVVNVANSIREVLPEIENTLPKGCKLEIVKDASEFVKSSVNDTMSNVILGVIITSIILFIFLRDLRSTFIVALSMPTSIISTFFLLKAAGLSLNMMTLMGLSVTVGVLVANSIVVIENIFRHKSLGENNQNSAIKGTTEVALAVMASTLTNLVVFIPIINMSSIVGMYLREFALSATFATIFSLIMSFTLTPMLSSLILPKEVKTGKIKAFFDSLENKTTDLYAKSLNFVLKNKWVSFATLSITLIAFVIIVGFYGPKLGFEFIPAIDDGLIKIEVEYPEGYNLQTTISSLNEIGERLKKNKEIHHISYDIGQIGFLDVGTNMAKIDVKLVDVSQRDKSLQKMISIFVAQLADIPGAKIKVSKGTEMGEGTAPVTFYVLGQDIAVLEQLKEKIIKKVKDTPGLINFDNSSKTGKPEITIVPKREKLIEAGLSVSDLAFTLRSAIEGLESSKYREFGNEYDIVVTLNDESVNSPDKIGNIPIISQSGGTYRLAQLADIKFSQGFSRILHRDKYVAIQFTGSTAEGFPLGNVTAEVNNRLSEISFPKGYSYVWGGNTKMMNEMFSDMAFAFILAVVLTYMLIAALLESFVQPLFIMLTIVLALMGALPALYYTDTSLGITSIMGIIMLIGIVVNNAILLLDYANQLRRTEGMPAREALLKAGTVKFKPQIMSATALMLGMLPMALGIGEAGSEVRTPMGIVSISGLFAATIMTVYVIPAIYYLLSRKRKKAI
ncbi:MAG: efflux RND transporter permease subunit [Candidatus Kapabacteria bacterium]|nr:efflux RND transporter permease subunit [Candidatus Kapabacteria bacterium]